MLRVISEFRPRYVVAENVRGAVNLALDTVYSGLVGEGYKVWVYVIPASAVGAPHQRERLFVVGVREDVYRQYTEIMENPGCELRQGGSECGEVEREAREGVASDSEFSGGTLWPTPTGTERSEINPKTGSGAGLSKTVKLWPTAQARDWKGSSERSLKGNEIDLPTAIKTASIKKSGQLNPDWVEQLMNFPEGWTDIEVDEPSEWAGWPALLGQEQYPFEYPRTTTGCKNRAKRLKALGNAVVPAQVYPFFRAIVEIERIVKEDNK